MNDPRKRYKAGAIACLTLSSLAAVGMIAAAVFASMSNPATDSHAPIVGVAGSLILAIIFGAFGALQLIAVRQYDKRLAANAALPQPLAAIPAPSLTEALKALTAPISQATKKIHIRAVCVEPGCRKCYNEMNERAFPEVVSQTAVNTIVIA